MKPKVIALTGGIGSGKSTVAKILAQEYSFDVIDCDELSKEAANDSVVLEQVKNLLGDGSVVAGQLNRKKVREIVFADSDLYQKYSALFWNKIRDMLSERIAMLQTVFVEIPVLDAFDFQWNEVWLVESSAQNRVERVVKRDEVSRENVLQIISRQKEITNYTRKIINNGSVEDLREQISVALQDIVG